MNKTPIEWTDYTWNPITGCLRGCSYCYARKMAHRFKRDFTPQLHEDRLIEPARLKTPSKIFVCSMSDLHGDGVEPKWIDEVWYAMTRARHHTYQLLTKHPERYDAGDPFPGTAMWFGATVTDQASWDHACEHLSKLPRDVVRWISAEPMLGYIWPHKWVPDWVVVGALSGHGKKAAASSAEKGRVLSDHLRLMKVPVFEKDSLGDKPVRRWPQ
jgi:protein gp37